MLVKLNIYIAHYNLTENYIWVHHLIPSQICGFRFVAYRKKSTFFYNNSDLKKCLPLHDRNVIVLKFVYFNN